jgi:hypothetical protein
MNPSETRSAPVLPPLPQDKWRREQQAFHKLLPELLRAHRDRFVAIHEGRVVESGEDKLEVARRAYARFGYVPIFVSRVTEPPATAVRIPSPRVVRV